VLGGKAGGSKSGENQNRTPQGSTYTQHTHRAYTPLTTISPPNANNPQGSVSCANPVLLELLPEFKSAQERADAIVEKCVLSFDSLPFIPAEPYNVLRCGWGARRAGCAGLRAGWWGCG